MAGAFSRLPFGPGGGADRDGPACRGDGHARGLGEGGLHRFEEGEGAGGGGGRKKVASKLEGRRVEEGQAEKRERAEQKISRV